MPDHDHSRPARLAAAALGLLALAGCQAAPGDQAAAGTKPAGQPAMQSTAASSTAAEPSAIQLNVNCPTPPEGGMRFRVGQAVFDIQPQLVREVVPAGLKPPLQRAQVVEAMRARTAAGAGCPGKPLDAALLAVGGAPGDVLLENTIGLQPASPGTLTAKFPELTGRLQAAPPKNCQKQAQGNILVCAGNETSGQRQIPVMYIITTERGRRLNNRGPLAARCPLGEDGKPQSCELIDELPGGVTVIASLSRLPRSTEALAAAQRAAVGYATALQR